MSSETLSRDEAIGQFCGVTGADEDRAKGLLEACDWNLELAINMHVDTIEGGSRNRGGVSTNNSAAGPSTSNNHAAGPSTSNANETVVISDSIDEGDTDDDTKKDSNGLPPRIRPSERLAARRAGGGHQVTYYDNDDDVRPPIPPVRQVLVQNPLGYPSEMPPRRYNTRTGAMSDVYDAFRDFQAEAQWQEMAQEGEASTAAGTVATDPARQRKTLQDLFRPPLELMFRGSLTSAREVGTLQNKWLLVNIQNGREFACQILNRDVWSNQTVKDILKEHFIFWQVYHDSFEGQRYIQFYKVSSFPHVSIIDPRTGEQMKSWPTSIDHNSFCDSVIEFLSEHPSPDGSSPDANTMKKLCVKEDEDDVVAAAVAANANANSASATTAAIAARTLYDQSEEAQLEAAIKASLQETQHNHENSNSSSKAFVEEDSYTDAIEESSDNEQPPEEVEDYKKYLGNDTEKFSDLVVRFPDGTRDQFKFPSDSLMKALFLLLTSRGFGMNQYMYVTTFPRRLLHELPATDTLHDAKLIRETIFVERKNIEEH